MGFNDALTTVGAKPAGRSCTVRIWRATLNKQDAAEFDAALLTETATSSIHKAMKVMGFKHSDGTVGRHRRGECACELR